ncbi:uncharacterized protein NDAI_0B02210 [Naumovozyma dairenensis CBS 421]|uniref:STAS domain-containing protein n=1 Tax=Naumovozyma dairenensis (strain ATCC 10597 / BCRC 20456 / CBS 421 / NBRC 0211 / NRRL Y-12639) TaxID=1071378 RepID=G0W645_NAUDC|nr:hypothetical protein NDAI_0B02210 [Naumovozyma dairenensis CBS 421]CCD23256.1 hypothetical protein NDAI_0B02210 [Naumovozyma dairenensis CBS 421]
MQPSRRFCDTNGSSDSAEAISQHNEDGLVYNQEDVQDRIAINNRSILTTSNIWDYLAYYFPCFSWMPNYTLTKFLGDLTAGLSVASFQIPLALSYATSLAHVEPLSGLYSLAITPFIYAIFGSVPQMIVGPESAISLVVGQAVEPMVNHDERISTISISIVVTFISGSFLLFLGIFRLGFLGNILSRALLRGFICSVGFVMIINSLISELKLDKVLATSPEHYHTPFEKILFLIKYGQHNYHAPTAILSLYSFIILMLMKVMKKRLMKRFKWVIFVPEILIVIVGTIMFSFHFDIKHKFDISIIGDFKVNGFDSLHNPLDKTNRLLLKPLLDAGIVCAVLGFFESTTASKALGTTYDLTVSSNRELVALGSMNIVGSLFGALPAFGGYGRSKINALSGGQTVMSGVCLGSVTLFTIKFFLPVVHNTPTCVLSVVTSVVGLTLLEEAPTDLKFYFQSHGYNELIVLGLTFITTIFYSVEVGICVGCCYSIISIIKHSAQSRIQILAKRKGDNRFSNADELGIFDGENNNNNTFFEPLLEDLDEDRLVVKIPEPLTFTNTEDLKERLSRLERFGSVRVHPGRRDLRSRDKTKYIIFDLHGMTYIDASAAQILLEIILAYNRRQVFVFFVRVPMRREVRQRFERSGLNKIIVTKSPSATNTGQNLFPELSPYFEDITDALAYIESMKSPVMTDDQESFYSNRLINSAIV